MKVFISWSGERSLQLAQATKNWLELIFESVKPWLSSNGIAAGERWSPAIAKELEITNFGILCLTRENILEPWILFEAGALAKSVESARVVPVLLDLDYSELVGSPLFQFQGKRATSEGYRDIAGSINEGLQPPRTEASLDQLCEMTWPTLQDRINAIPTEPAQATPIKSQPQLLQDLVEQMRGVELRLHQLTSYVIREEVPALRNYVPPPPRRVVAMQSLDVLQNHPASAYVLSPADMHIVSALAHGDTDPFDKYSMAVIDKALLNARREANRLRLISEKDEDDNEEDQTNA